MELQEAAAAHPGRRGPEAWSELEDDIFSESFLLARPLLAAIRATEPVVLLIDEIDRVEVEAEALMLEVLSDFQVTIPELGTITATRRPMVFLTSNDTRDLSEALQRRALYLHIDYPTVEREREILLARVDGLTRDLAEQVSRVVRPIRDLDLKKTPSISESIDWARTLVLLGIESIRPDDAGDTLHVLLKYDADIQKARGDWLGLPPDIEPRRAPADAFRQPEDGTNDRRPVAPALREAASPEVLHGLVRELDLTNDECWRSSRSYRGRPRATSSSCCPTSWACPGSSTTRRMPRGTGPPRTCWARSIDRTRRGSTTRRSIVRDQAPGRRSRSPAGSAMRASGTALPGAAVDVWQADTAGVYSNEDARLAPWHLRGRQRADGDGRFSIETVRPRHYTVKDDGPVGRLLAALGRHPFRPAHIHFMVEAAGYRTLVTQAYVGGGPYLDDDAITGVKSDLVVDVVDGTIRFDVALARDPAGTEA